MGFWDAVALAGLDQMQRTCTSLQTDNHINTSSVVSPQQDV